MFRKGRTLVLAALCAGCFYIGGYMSVSLGVKHNRQREDSVKYFIQWDTPESKQSTENISSSGKRTVIPQKMTSKLNATVYLVMPTHHRLIQWSLLTMQCQNFAGVPNFHLILIEDATKPRKELTDLMAKHKLNFTHLACSSRDYCAKTKCNSKTFTAKGSVPRNCGLSWFLYANITDGVIYFADDDNFYQHQLFEELRKTRTVGLFPVGGFPFTWMSSPLIKNGKIHDFVDPWKARRPWPVDMAGFSVSVKFWRQRGAPLFTFKKGYLETKFIEALKISKKDVDILADGASKIYVWHNSIKKAECLKKNNSSKSLEKYDNYRMLKDTLVQCA